jgi:DNA-binding beta-propeller fold protein YncE
MRQLWLTVAVGACLGVLATGFRSATAQRTGGLQPPAFEVDRGWPTIPNGWILGEVSSVAVDGRDHIWIIHRPRSVPAEQRSRAAPPVLEFDGAGQLLSSWGGPAVGYEWPEREHGIYVDEAGFVWIGGNNGSGSPPPPGRSDDMLLKFTSAGRFVLQIGHSGQSRGNADTSNVHQAADAFVSRRTNELFVADGYGNQRVIVFDANTGAFKRMWGAFGSRPDAPSAPTPAAQTVERRGAARFGLVHSIKVSTDGQVYVADRSNKRVQVFSLDGAYRQQVAIGGGSEAGQTAAGLAFSPDARQRFLYVADLGNARVLILDRQTLTQVGSFGSRGRAPGEFDVLHHIAADSKGNLYTAEIGRNRRVQKFALKRS